MSRTICIVSAGILLWAIMIAFLPFLGFTETSTTKTACPTDVDYFSVEFFQCPGNLPEPLIVA